MNWEKTAQEKFKAMVEMIPVFHRHIAEDAVIRRAEESAQARNSCQIEEKDVVGAFFSDVPGPFYGLMIRLLERAGFDYKKYGFPLTIRGNDKKK